MTTRKQQTRLGDRKVRQLVLVPLGGMCNRLRAILSARELARRWDVELRVVWLRDAGLNARFEDLFLTENNNVQTLVNDHQEVHGDEKDADLSEDLMVEDSAAWYCYGVARKRNLWIPGLWQRCNFDSRLTEADILGVLQRCGVSQEVSGEEKSHQLSEALWTMAQGRTLIQSGLGFFPADDRQLLRLFQPSKDVNRLLAPRLAMITSHTVGVHIRRTDNALAIQHSPLSAFETAMEADIQRDSQTRFYVATDDHEVLSHLQRRFPGRIDCSPVTAAGNNVGRSLVNGFFRGRNSRLGMQDAAAELFALIASPRFHGSYWSSFSDAVAACHPAGTADIICISDSQSFV